jgi:phenylpyruvate tautomerase PptA (4-oxalocrotonate tautomerase family)
MPVIRVSCPANALTAEQKAQLAPLLTDGVMGQEVDPVTDAGRDITTLMFNEIADHNCFIGGTPVDKPKHPGDTFWMVEIIVAAGFFDQARREAVQAAVKKAFVTVLDDDGSVMEHDGVRVSPTYLVRLASLIIEIPEGSWGVGGRTSSAVEIGKLAGTDQSRKRFTELQENTARLKATRVS